MGYRSCAQNAFACWQKENITNMFQNVSVLSTHRDTSHKSVAHCTDYPLCSYFQFIVGYQGYSPLSTNNTDFPGGRIADTQKRLRIRLKNVIFKIGRVTPKRFKTH